MVHERPLLRIVSANQAHHKDPKSPRCPEATKFIHRSPTVDPGKVIHDRSGVLLALSGPRRGPARALWRCDPCRLNSGGKWTPGRSAGARFTAPPPPPFLLD